MACLSGDPWLIQALQEGQGDFFDQHLMPVAFPRISKHYGTVDEYKAAEPVAHKEDRTKVKAVVYGLSFARGARAIAQSLKMPTQEAQDIIDNFLGKANVFAEWREDVKEAAINPAKRDLLISPFGRRFQSEIITTKNFAKVQREALAFLPQATASDICLTTAIRIAPQLREWGYNIFNIVHDAIMVEGAEDNADTVGEYIMAEFRATGEMVFGTTVPFLSDYSVGPSWSDLS
jgi:DNA polymerase I-like protein with 3'-5' exonuclease and polymerase domains